jgi:LmbE family N-acetylglucosaminyl deacetylase
MYIVAHPDDSLLFQSPSLLQNIQSGFNVLTVHVTAGDNGSRKNYWRAREAGIRAAYAQMAGVENSWTESTLSVESHQVVFDTLTAQPNIAVVFMRLPDGGYPEGTGTARYGFQSLRKLWEESEATIMAVDRSTSYALPDLVNTLGVMMNLFQPQLIATHDYANSFGDGDHTDHYVVAYLSHSAHESYSSPHNFVGYEGYPTDSKEANVNGPLLATKQAVFQTYGSFDRTIESGAASFADSSYAVWLRREYTVGSQPVGLVANAGFSQTMTPGAIAQLDGSKSSVQGENSLNYKWTQTSGLAVRLSSEIVAKPTFAVPIGPTLLTFSLTVSEGPVTSAPSTVTVTVTETS